MKSLVAYTSSSHSESENSQSEGEQDFEKHLAAQESGSDSEIEPSKKKLKEDPDASNAQNITLDTERPKSKLPSVDQLFKDYSTPEFLNVKHESVVVHDFVEKKLAAGVLVSEATTKENEAQFEGENPMESRNRFRVEEEEEYEGLDPRQEHIRKLANDILEKERTSLLKQKVNAKSQGKPQTVKDREKMKRVKGQSSHQTWKPEEMMKMRQEYD